MSVSMDSIQDIFDYVKALCKEQPQTSETAYNVWIRPLQIVSMTGNNVLLSVPSEFHLNMIQTHHIPLLENTFEAVMGFPVQITLCIAGKEPAAAAPVKAPEPPQPEEEPSDNDLGVDPDLLNLLQETETTLIDSFRNAKYEFTFDTFIVGESNRFAYAACRAVSQQKIGQSETLPYNPLFIYGPSGLGKTHLLHAIRHDYQKNNPDAHIIYITSETFINELITSISKKNMEEFRQKYRKADLLMIDDIQFIAGKTQMQEEFFHTFNELHQYGKQIVITSDRPPKEIKTLEDRLKNRFEWGLLADITYPEYETRVAIIQRKASLLNLELSPEICDLLADKLKSNIRQLEGAVKKLKAHQTYGGAKPTITIANSVVREILNNENQPIPYTVDRIIEEVAKTYDISPEDIRSKKKSGMIPLARQVSIYIVHELTGMSQEAIGNEFGGRDHSTIVYSLKTIKKKIDTDPKTKAIVEDIVKNIRSK
jgi:chromosomal replication initiator protein